jgi:hypothetical protein
MKKALCRRDIEPGPGYGHLPEKDFPIADRNRRAGLLRLPGLLTRADCRPPAAML